MHFLDMTNLLSWLGSDVVFSIISSLVTLAGSYLILRERVVKLEILNSHLTEYIDSQIKVLQSEISYVKEDIQDFKDLNKETQKSLAENTAAIRELKLVLELLREQIQIQRQENGR